MKLTDHTCSCNDLTNFEYQVRAMTGNGSYVIFFFEFGRKNLWKHFKSWVRDPWVCPWHIFRDYWRSCSIPFPERCRLCNLQTSASYRQCTGVCCNNSWIWVVPSWFSKSKKKSLVISSAHYICNVFVT